MTFGFSMEEFISKLDSFHGYAAVKGRLNENRRDTYFIDQEERVLKGRKKCGNS